jgi:thiamine biosynthesis lipoprotein
MRSVTVVAKDSGLADLLSTALFLMPPDEGLTFLEQFPGVDALWILNDLSIQVSPGIQNYLVNAQTILNGQTK